VWEIPVFRKFISDGFPLFFCRWQQARLLIYVNICTHARSNIRLATTKTKLCLRRRAVAKMFV